jgi:uncharacterized protein YegJ (DUF2314 family)
MLIRSATDYTEAGLIKRFSLALGKPFQNGGTFPYLVKEIRPGIFGIRVGPLKFGMMNLARRYGDTPANAYKMDARLRLAWENHAAWTAIDLMGEVTEEQKVAAYRVIGALIAGLIDDNCLAIGATETGKMVFNYSSAEIAKKLRSEDPLSALEVSDPIVYVSGKDPRLKAAIEEAQRRWPQFTNAFARSKPGQGFAVKGPFSDGKHTEFMWMEVARIEGDFIHGRLSNDPNGVKGLKLHDAVSLRVSQVQDWVYADSGRMHGGFTVAVLQQIDRERQQSG